MRIVLDTNVVISGLLWRGTPHRRLEICRHRDDVELVTSRTILAELVEVLRRPTLAGRLRAIGRRAAQVAADYAALATLVSPKDTPRLVALDADDDEVIAAAVEASAAMIVTGDKRHLLPIGRHRGIDIVDAAEAVGRIESSSVQDKG